MPSSNKIYDIQERTKKFAKDIIILARELKIDAINQRIVTQLIGSSGSIGANYCEANEAESDKDFIHKMKIARKEIKETKYWLELLATSNPKVKDSCQDFWIEADEMIKIFSVMIKNKEIKLEK